MSFAVVQTHINCRFRSGVSSFLSDWYPCQILFLNKDDLFMEKIKHSNIKNTFPVSTSYELIPKLTWMIAPRITMAYPVMQQQAVNILRSDSHD